MMKLSKTLMSLLTAAVALLSLSLAFAVPSGAIPSETAMRYQNEAPVDWGSDEDEDFVENWDEDASAAPYRVTASAAASDVVFTADAASLALSIDQPGNATIEANYTDASYADDTISVTLEDVRQDNSNYHVARVQIATASQLRTAVAGGFGSNRTYKTSVFAQSMNAVLAVNGDFYTKTKAGFIIRQGETYRTKTSKNMDLLLIDENADFHIVLRGHDNQKAEVAALQAEHSIINGFFFGPALVVDGVTQEVPSDYQFNPSGCEPRAAIGQLAPLTYVVVTVDGRIDDSNGVTLQTLANFMGQLGCQQAYALDGGNSSALVFHNKLVSVKSVDERSVSDIIYFATATQGE